METTDELWKTTYSGGQMRILMPEQDAIEIEKLDRKANLTVENYVRRSLGFSDWPEEGSG
jgi:hypothetical protein